MTQNKKYLINIIGPTAVGKTDIAIHLAKKYSAEIFSSDSRQIFKEMNIGTAKPSDKELSQVVHHFIHSHSIQDNYSAGQYEDEIIPALGKYFQGKDIAILCGGTGLYIDAVLFGLDSFPAISNEIEIKVDQLLQKEGLTFLQNEIKRLDPDYYAKVDLQNERRISRALKVIYASGKTYSSFLNRPKKQREFIPINILLERERNNLYQRINTRVDQMFEKGQLEEAKSLHQYKQLRSLQTVGYKEIFSHLDGEIELEQCKEEIKKNSRRYAKRQITWFKKYEAKSFHPSKQNEIEEYINAQISTSKNRLDFQ